MQKDTKQCPVCRMSKAEQHESHLEVKVLS